MADTNTMRTDLDRVTFALFAGIYGVVGCVVFAVAVAIGDWVVPGNDMIADTISAMAAGQMSWIVDTGIITYSTALMVLGLGAAALHPGGTRWSAGCVGLVALGMTVFLVGFRNEYGDGDTDTAEEFHIFFVYILGGLFAVVPWAMSRGADVLDAGSGRWMRWTSVLWILASPWFFFMPDGYDGIYERTLGLVTFIFVLALSRALIRAGRR